jgi:hypothetical protein
MGKNLTAKELVEREDRRLAALAEKKAQRAKQRKRAKLTETAERLVRRAERATLTAKKAVAKSNARHDEKIPGIAAALDEVPGSAVTVKVWKPDTLPALHEPIRVAATTDGGMVWALTRNRTIRQPSRAAALRAMGTGVYGRWARMAGENTPQGRWAFLHLVPRIHGEQTRWVVADFQWEWQSICLAYDTANIIAPINHGKSEQITFAMSAHELGCNPNLRLVIASNVAELSIRRVRALRMLVDENDDYRRVFPNVKPGSLWTDRAWTLQRTNASDPNPTCQGVGLNGAILGARTDRLTCDDMDDLESTWTAASREKAQTWVRTNLISRLGRIARARSIQTAWHPEDMSQMFRSIGWPTFRYKIRKLDGSYLWKEQWDAAREEKMRRELGETAAARMLDSIPRTGELSRCKEEWIHAALKNGQRTVMYESVRADNGCYLVVGVDLAVGRGENNDKAAFATVLCDERGNRHLINLESGRWSGPDLLMRIKQHARRYPGARIVVENNAAQDYLRQFASDEVAGIIPYTTGRSKADPTFGIESIFTEFHAGKWHLPCDAVGSGLPLSYQAHAEVQALISQCFDYAPGSHTGDSLMAVFLAREGIVRGAGIVENVRLWG